MSSIPDSLGAIIWACQTHYSNDSIAELEHSLLHRGEKNRGERGQGWNLVLLCFSFSFLFLRCGIIPFSFSSIPLKRKAGMQPYVPSRTNKSPGKGVASPASWGGSKRDTAPCCQAASVTRVSFPRTGQVRRRSELGLS